MEWTLFCNVLLVIMALTIFAYLFEKICSWFDVSYKITNKDELDMWHHINHILSSDYFLTNEALYLSHSELTWLYQRHEELYEPGWYSVDPLSSKQIQLLMYDHIKRKIKDNVPN